jgi:uncharacterized membrane protein YphA (DoxX/SURF4 family)
MRFTIRQAETNDMTGTRMRSRKGSVALWTLQGLLAVVFLGAGISKLVLPIEDLAREVAYPALFIRFIGVCEVLGALGLVLPGLLRIRTELTPLAASGLVVIMVGAVVVTLAIGGGVAALLPFGVGLLLVVVAYRRGQPVVTRRAVHQAGRRLAGVWSR